MNDWFVYILRCADASLYTGITTDIHRRVREHNEDNRKGAACTRGRRPVTLIYQEHCHSRSLAAKREYQIKRLERKDKLLLSEGNCVPMTGNDRD